MTVDREEVRRESARVIHYADEGRPARWYAARCLALLDELGAAEERAAGLEAELLGQEDRARDAAAAAEVDLAALEAELEEATRALVRERVKAHGWRAFAESNLDALRRAEARLTEQRQRAEAAESFLALEKDRTACLGAALSALEEAARGLLAWVDGCRLPGAANAAGPLRTELGRVAP